MKHLRARLTILESRPYPISQTIFTYCPFSFDTSPRLANIVTHITAPDAHPNTCSATSQIQLEVTINPSAGSAVLDFAGTGCEVRGNLNAPISVVHSAVIYCMRSMLDLDIPLNAGCLVPLDSEFSDSCCSSESFFESVLCHYHDGFDVGLRGAFPWLRFSF